MKRRMLLIVSLITLLTACTPVNEQIDSEIPANATAPIQSDTAKSHSTTAEITQAESNSDISDKLIDEDLSETVPVISETEMLTEPPMQTAEEIEANEAAESDGTIEQINLTFYQATLQVGEKTMPIVEMLPSDAPDKSEIWTSSDESVATVDDIGNITAVGEGECTVTVRSAVCPEAFANVSVKVKPSPELTYIDGILIANKSYPLPADYNPGFLPETQAAFDKMQAAAADEGLNIYISSSFRSYDYQAKLYQRYVDQSGQAEADRYSARPGHSEHQTGLALDLNTIDISFEDTDEYAWVKEHCAEYGFIIRYTKDGEDKTGYMYEPWHLRYLGVETAKKVTDSGLTLEEYLGITSQYE